MCFFHFTIQKQYLVDSHNLSHLSLSLCVRRARVCERERGRYGSFILEERERERVCVCARARVCVCACICVHAGMRACVLGVEKHLRYWSPAPCKNKR